MTSLLLKFKLKDTSHGVTRDTLKALAEEMGINETTAVHIALSRLARDMLPAYEMDDAPLKASEIAQIRRAAKPLLPTGRVRRARSLL